MNPHKICDRCHKPYLRSNRTRLWVATNFGHRYGWIKVEMKICCRCYRAGDAQHLAKELNPKWRALKPVERIAAVTVAKAKDANPQPRRANV